MKQLLFFGIALFTLVLSQTSNAETIPANHNLIEYTGRIDFSDQFAPKFSYSGVSIRACFTGTSIAVILDDDMGENYYHAILDGVVLEKFKVEKGKKTYTIKQGLDDTIHEIELFKRTELTFGKTQFFGFVLDEGDSLVEISDKRNLFIEYIGNSITCGYGNEGKNGDDFLAITENHYMTYAAITSRNFNARHMAVSRSGIGIYRNYDGPAQGNSDCMTNLYSNIFLYDENPKYDFAQQPDLVCINLGTNDFSTAGADSALYVSNYFRLIDSIQYKYENPEILCLVGSMMSGSSLKKIKSYLQFIVDSANNKGKGKVTFFEMSAQTGDLGIAVHSHPTVAQHQRNAQELTNYIQSLKGWKINPLLQTVKINTTTHIQIEFNTPLIDDDNNFEGFSIGNETINHSIDKVYTDTANNAILHIILKDGLIPAEKVILKYKPGTVKSTDGELLPEISNFEVNNILTETTITDISVKSDGVGIKFTFNKNISKASSIEGLEVLLGTEALLVDSFLVSAKTINLYLHEYIQKGQSLVANYNGNGIMGTDEVSLTVFTNMAVDNHSMVAISDEVFENALVLYPNPNKTEVFHYNFNEKYSYDQFVVIDAKGSVVERGNLKQKEGEIDLRGKLSNGIYFFKFNNATQNITQKIVINK